MNNNLLLQDATWRAIVSAANRSEQFREKIQHLVGVTVAIMIDGRMFYLEFHRGRLALLDTRPLTAIELQLSGTAEDWSELIGGKIPYVRSIHFQQGTLTVNGNGLFAAWLTPGLSELFRLSASAMSEVV